MSDLTAPFTDPWRPDYQLLRDSPITRFNELADLEGVQERLSQFGYRVVTADASSGDRRSVLSQLNNQVREWPSGYGTTLEGFNDALRDLESTATAFAFIHFEHLRRSDSRAAAAILDSLVDAAWFHLLEGRLVMGLVHSPEAIEIPQRMASEWRGWWVRADE